MLIGTVGMSLLVNYNRRLPKSKLNEELYLDIIRTTSLELKNTIKADNLSKENLQVMLRKAHLLLCAAITIHETMKENELLWNSEESTLIQITDSLLSIIKDCKRWLTEGFDQDIPKIYGQQARFAFEILGLQILYQALGMKKVKRGSIPPPVLTMIDFRLNNIKSYAEGAPNAAENITFLSLCCLLLSSSKILCGLVQIDQFIKNSSTILKSEEESVYHKALTYLLAILLSQKAVNEEQIAAMKVSLGVLYMDILAINETGIEDELWAGINQNPLENVNLMEYWRDNTSKIVASSSPDFPSIPEGCCPAEDLTTNTSNKSRMFTKLFSGHEGLDLFDGSREDAHVLESSFGHQHVIFDAHASDVEVLLEQVEVDVLGFLRVLLVVVDDASDEVDAGLDGDDHACLQIFTFGD